jgi:Fe-S cluster assembly protein SufD
MAIHSTLPDLRDSATQTKVDRALYLQNLLNQRLSLPTSVANSLEIGGWLQGLRDRASDIISELAIPTTKDEEWRFTDLSPILPISFVPGSLAKIGVDDIQPYALPETADNRLVFVNGVYAPALSVVANLPEGVVVGNLGKALEHSVLANQLQAYLAKALGAEEVFTSLNTASFTDTAIVYVPRNIEVDTPIQLLYVSTTEESPVLSHPRCLVIAESGSRLTLVEDFVTVGAGVYFTNSVTEIWVEENAKVNHTRVQRDSTAAFHIGKTAVSQARDSHYTCHAVSLGSSISRHNLEVYQTGEQTETILNGLTIIGGEQLADTHSAIAYTKPHGTSRQIQKCIIDDRAHAVFNGKVFVPKPAQLTDAGQLNRNLLLSPKARVDTKPQLEITADNVKCSHGATVSQLDSDEVFYLQSRGIDENSARKLLVYAFAYELITEIPIPSLRDTLSAIVRTHE